MIAQSVALLSLALMVAHVHGHAHRRMGLIRVGPLSLEEKDTTLKEQKQHRHLVLVQEQNNQEQEKVVSEENFESAFRELFSVTRASDESMSYSYSMSYSMSVKPHLPVGLKTRSPERIPVTKQPKRTMPSNAPTPSPSRSKLTTEPPTASDRASSNVPTPTTASVSPTLVPVESMVPTTVTIDIISPTISPNSITPTFQTESLANQQQQGETDTNQQNNSDSQSQSAAASCLTKGQTAMVSSIVLVAVLIMTGAVARYVCCRRAATRMQGDMDDKPSAGSCSGSSSCEDSLLDVRLLDTTDSAAAAAAVTMLAPVPTGNNSAAKLPRPKPYLTIV